MRSAEILVNLVPAGILTEIEKGKQYRFSYYEDYHGQSVSLTMPLKNKTYEYQQFPPFFDGLLPEGMQLEGLLKIGKIDADDYFLQLITVGHDLVGNVTVEALK